MGLGTPPICRPVRWQNLETGTDVAGGMRFVVVRVERIAKPGARQLLEYHGAPAAQRGGLDPGFQGHRGRQIETEASATVTQSFMPSNDSARPKRPPATQVAPEIVPARPLPDASAAIVPAPSLNA
jgi:hypothetical protein